MTNTNIVLKRIVADAVLRSGLLSTPADLDRLLDATVDKLTRALRVQDRHLNEQEVAQKWPFLNVVRLRNYRYKDIGPKYYKLGSSRNSPVYYKVADVETWIVSKYQLEPFIETMARGGRKTSPT